MFPYIRKLVGHKIKFNSISIEKLPKEVEFFTNVLNNCFVDNDNSISLQFKDRYPLVISNVKEVLRTINGVKIIKEDESFVLISKV